MYFSCCFKGGAFARQATSGVSIEPQATSCTQTCESHSTRQSHWQPVDPAPYVTARDQAPRTCGGVNPENQKGSSHPCGCTMQGASAVDERHASTSTSVSTSPDCSTEQQPCADISARRSAEVQHILVQAEQDVLADIRLVEVLGTGGLAVTYGGYWREGVKVAVKMFITRSNTAEIASTSLSDVPPQALAEALLSKNLAHPNIVHTYSTRCCELTLPFLAAALYGSPEDHPSTLLEGICLLSGTPRVTPNTCTSAGHLLPTVEDMWDSVDVPEDAPAFGAVPPPNDAQDRPSQPGTFFSTCDEVLTQQGVVAATHEALEVLRTWQGATPLHGGSSRSNRSTLDGKLDEWEDFSQDGFGSPDDSRRTLSWSEMLSKLHPMPGDFLTCLVMRYCDLGTLEKAVMGGVFMYREIKDAQQAAQERRKRYRALLRTTREIAQALEYLHDSNVIHGDLKPSNVLLVGSRLDVRGFTACVADFGLSKLVCNRQSTEGSGKGTIQYMAPEQLATGRITTKTDIYALGITLWAMATRSMPYKGFDVGQIAKGVQSGVLRPSWPEGVFPELADLFYRCVAYSPLVRPTASDIVRDLTLLELQVRKAHRSAPPSMASGLSHTQQLNLMSTWPAVLMR